MFRRLSLILAVCLVAGSHARAQVAKLTATAPAEVAAGDNFRITWELNANGSEFVAPEITGFQVLSGPNQSSSFQMVNGNVSQSLSFSYIVRAQKEGTYEVGPARIKANGQVIQSNALTIKVKKGAPAQQQAQQGVQQQPQQQQQAQQPRAPGGEDVFAKIEVSRTNVMLGEKLTARLKVYTRFSIVGFDSMDFPSFDGFYNRAVDQGNQIQMEQEVVNGVTYQVGVIRTFVLYPQKTGKLEISPLSMTAIVRQEVQGRRRSFWDPFGISYQDIPMELRSKPVTITVDPLPAGRPVDFSGLTGNFKLTAKMDRNEVRSNEAVNLTVTISGEGNLFQVQKPKIDFPPDIEAYDPKVSDNIKVTAGGISGSKTFEYVLIPRYAGDFEIGPFNFSYFDPSSKTYKNSGAPAFDLVVEKGKGDDDAGPRAIAITGKEDIKMIGSDIRYIKQGQYPLREKGDHFFRSGIFLALLTAPVLLFGLVLGYAGLMERQGADVAGMRSRTATKLAKKRLATAKKLLDGGDATAFYEEVFKALTEYVAFRHHIPVSALTKQKIRETLTAKNLRTEDVDGFIAALDKAEFARFAPGADKQMGSMYDEALGAIVNLEA
jgi:uncharacterized glyoxalase superfamily protein PhnB